MTRFLVEVTQSSQQVTERKIKDAIRTIGSHFATHANWIHENGRSSGTMIVEAIDKWGALGIVPPGLRSDAHVFALDSDGTQSSPPILPIEPLRPILVAA